MFRFLVMGDDGVDFWFCSNVGSGDFGGYVVGVLGGISVIGVDL